MEKTKNCQVNLFETDGFKTKENLKVDNTAEEMEEETMTPAEEEQLKDTLASGLLFIVTLIAACSIFSISLLGLHAVSTLSTYGFIAASIFIGFVILGFFGVSYEYIKDRIGRK